MAKLGVGKRVKGTYKLVVYAETKEDLSLFRKDLEHDYLYFFIPGQGTEGTVFVASLELEKVEERREVKE